MGEVPKTIKQWQMIQPTTFNKETKEKIPGKLELAEIPVPELKEGEVLVEIAGCGVCHTDLGYFYDGVPTVSKPPLALGHEIAGTVVAGDPAWIGKEVIIPAVMPCRKCILCKTGRGNRCLAQKMPGNSIGVYGGFASHIPVPTIDLCLVPSDKKGFALEQLAVVADAVTTPYQAAKRADLQPGDNVVIIGATGGVGVYMVQMAKALGAKTVIGIARNMEKLQRALKYGCDAVISTLDKDNKAIVGEWRNFCKSNGIDTAGWKIFEVTGTKAGQDLALDLLSFVGKLILVGFGMSKSEYMFSKLMAFDAEIIGTWGCLPEYYPIVLDMVLLKRIQIEPFVEVRPMSTIAATFEEIHKAGSPAKRVVLKPDF
ncbi:MAG TPA: 6-hydroxycyclohex-1-ene-1-carbonyl-CoA dehydrogenase [Syntrophorhabdaceae bacterium]|nr:6-hydroxycyclohex-1-ene-1-carbonyl-CoA dehydrogenase [Syntrophorhabdaceae bacterium]